ncbi:MAG: YCF48-related protein [Candidatus Falkowbacteria bacterium]
MFNKKAKILLVILPALFLAGCGGINIQTNTSTKTSNDLAGVFVSPNKGEAFKYMSAKPSAYGNPGSISGVNVNELKADPSDNAAIYLATEEKGLFYTYNVNNGWNEVLSLPQKTIADVAVDALDKCNIYAAIENKLYKSSDCARTWSEIYVDSNPAVTVNAVAVDHYNNKSVYLGTSRGEVMKSLDYGRSWKTIQRLTDGVAKIFIAPNDSRVVYVASSKNGLFRFNSSDSMNLNDLSNYQNKFDGKNWLDLNASLKDYNLGFNFKGLVFSDSDSSMFLAGEKILLKSSDGGATWTKINLVTPESETKINAIAVSPKNSKEIYYVTDTTFYKSVDGGNTWITKALPTSLAGSSLLIDSKDTNIIYMGIKKIKK